MTSTCGLKLQHKVLQSQKILSEILKRAMFLVLSLYLKLDQGALGMSDPCGTLKLALKPNSVPRNNCLLTNFYFCAN